MTNNYKNKQFKEFGGAQEIEPRRLAVELASTAILNQLRQNEERYHQSTNRESLRIELIGRIGSIKSLRGTIFVPTAQEYENAESKLVEKGVIVFEENNWGEKFWIRLKDHQREDEMKEWEEYFR